ncbi:MAG: serine O-acetyltransferase [Angelakisella sp.]|nr:serine O-acetyltransferase [Angelakisella sp.]
MLKGLRQDIAAVKQRDPAARNTFEVLLLYSGLHAIMLHRPAHWLYTHKFYFLARFLSQFARFLTGIEIHPGAKMGRGILIDHGSGVVIGETAEVGDGCTIYQGVTLGGTGKDQGKRHPTLGKNVLVGAGAKILGPFTVGDNCKIAAGAVLLTALEEGCTAVGVPAKVVHCNGCKLRTDNSQLDQIHIPDPIAQELTKLEERIAQLEAQLAQKSKSE